MRARPTSPDRHRRIVVLTGAGISRESGLDTFRDAGGIWSQVRLEDVATPEAFARDPARVHAFYNARRVALLGVQPNPAHRALARLESECAGELLIATQNVDDLHERAGSRGLLHMHGELRRVRCTACGARPRWGADTGQTVACPACGQCGLRPDVVWFGEVPMHMQAIEAALARCDLFVAIGTSGTVYRATGFVEIASRRAETLELNLEPSANPHFDRGIAGPATRIVPALVAELLGA